MLKTGNSRFMQPAIRYTENESFVETFRFTDPERRVFKAKEKPTVSQWAEKHRIVAKGPVPGPWFNQLSYLVEPLDTCNQPWARKTYLCFAPQTSQTSVAINCLLYAIDQDPGPSHVHHVRRKGGQTHQPVPDHTRNQSLAQLTLSYPRQITPEHAGDQLHQQHGLGMAWAL
jgi:hypothetical protein